MSVCCACLHTHMYHSYTHVKGRPIPLIEKSILNIWSLVSETNGRIRIESRESVVSRLWGGGGGVTDGLA